MTTVVSPEIFDGPTSQAVAHFNEVGWVLTQTLNDSATQDLRRWVDEVALWPEPGDGWLHHREMTDEGARLCRTENFTPFHSGLDALLTTGPMIDVAATLLGEQAVLYKEKINYKLPGGAGYAPHQDAPAYRFVDVHVSAMIAVDDATPENGCLEVVSGAHHEVCEMDDAGCIAPSVVENFEWMSVPVSAGQTLWFHSRTPHRSGPNTSVHSRRALYPTYNALREGDLREQYYAQKLAEWAAATRDGSHVTVSLIGDFQGRPVQ